MASTSTDINTSEPTTNKGVQDIPPINDENPPKPAPDPELREAIEDQVEHELALHEAGTGSKWLKRFRWDRFNAEKLVAAEQKLFERVPLKILSRLIPVKNLDSCIYTISTKADEVLDSKIPYVLLHGFGGGVGIWASNLASLASQRPIHAIDLPGFGRSSRPHFSHDPIIAEDEFIQSIEDWREAMGIDKMVLVGHSFGGYLSTSYALKHPSHIRHLVLVDPWGFPEKPGKHEPQHRMPLLIRGIGALNLNPFTSLRIAGPFALNVIRKLRPDMGSRFNFADDPNAIYEYIYQINARKPTGEQAFKSMTERFAWARRPLILRIKDMSPTVPITFVYGKESWIDSGAAFEVQTQRSCESYVDIKTIPDASHHVYADNSEGFNEAMKEISKIIDDEKDLNLTLPKIEDFLKSDVTE